MLIGDTGMRLSKACGLLTSDICLDGEILNRLKVRILIEHR